jgi:hypothetical protein
LEQRANDNRKQTDASKMCDLHHIFKPKSQSILERLTVFTPVAAILRFRRSEQRFERDSYHGDALPTELTGPVFSCLTCGFAPQTAVFGVPQR